MSSEAMESGGGSPPQSTATEIRPLWTRAIALITSPRSVFEELSRKPAWIGAALLSAVISLVISFLIFEPVIYPTMIEQAEEQATSSEQMEQTEALFNSPAFKGFIIGTAPVVSFVWVIGAGLLMFGAVSLLMGGRTSARHGFSVAAHAFLVFIPRGLVLIPLMIMRQDPTITLGPGVLMPASEAIGFAQGFIASFLGGLDLFNLWALSLCILGMSVVSGVPTRRVGMIFGIGYFLIILVWSLLAGARTPS